MAATRLPGALACAWLLAGAVACASSCRKSDADLGRVRDVAPNAAGANGCSGTVAAFAQAPVPVPLALLQPGPLSQVTAAAGGELLYATGAGATLVEIDVGSPDAPLERELVTAGAAAAFLATFGILEPPAFSGVAVIGDTELAVVEHTANVILRVGRVVPDQIALLAGQPNLVPGQADGLALGPAGLARFSFEDPCQLCPTGPGGAELFVADSGNHSLRLVANGQVVTVAGAGFPLSLDGAVSQSAFDTPSGLSATCENQLLVSELGAFGSGQRLRRVTLFTAPSFLGGIGGSIETLVGDGVDATSGGSAAPFLSGTLAQVSRPVSPLATAGGEVYWIDSGTGVLRRLSGSAVDCPFFPDCDAALAAPLFTPGGLSSLTRTPSGALWVLDAAAAALLRIP